MTINQERDGNWLTLRPEGRLDTSTAPALEEIVMNSFDGLIQVTMDFEKLEYLSSAGLRVLLAAQKKMNKQGEMVLRNVNETVMEVFEVTGFVDILTIASKIWQIGGVIRYPGIFCSAARTTASTPAA